jgi:hypothetical protein
MLWMGLSNDLVKALRNTNRGQFPAWPVDPSGPFKGETRRLAKEIPAWATSCYTRKANQWLVKGPDDQEELVTCPYSPGQVYGIKEALLKGEDGNVHYRAGGDLVEPVHAWEWKRDLLPGRFMPAWALRERVIIKAVGAERVQDIVPMALIFEGLFVSSDDLKAQFGPAYTAAQEEAEYRKLWEQVWEKAYKGTYQVNPWVWVLRWMRQ